MGLNGNSPSFPLLISRKDAAKMLGICVRSLDKHVIARRLTVVQLGRRRLFRPQDIQAFVSTMLVGTAGT